MNISHYQNLDVWKESILLSKKVYKLSDILPKEERYSLLDQMKRAAISIASNIAEGSARGSIVENIRFLYISKGSCAELETQIILCRELGFIDPDLAEEYISHTTAILKMLSGLISQKRKTLS